MLITFVLSNGPGFLRDDPGFLVLWNVLGCSVALVFRCSVFHVLVFLEILHADFVIGLLFCLCHYF